MSWPRLVVAVENPTIRFLLLDRLNQLGIQFLMCDLDDAICEVASVVLSDHIERDVSSKRFVLIRDSDDIESALIATLIRLHGIHTPLFAVIGIDPGLRFGIALVVDGILIHSLPASTPSAAASVTTRWASILRHRFAACELVIRVGRGSPLFATLFLRTLNWRSKRFVVELVDEHHTTLTSGSHNDQSSAALIAQRPGSSAETMSLELEHKEGYIRLLKRLFQRLTGGAMLSTEIADRILSGTMSLDEAVANYSSKKE
ncbi:MAG: hypothetical protein K9W43_00260 [Candidatus Thorarchaeota archaeon]|nr:hypothetical protein [Candidatus Thorarchaeota archaeon]